MNTDTIRKLSALCKRWDELDEQKRDVEAQIERMIAQTEANAVEPVESPIQVGDLVEVVSMKGGDTVLSDVGKGGVVSYVYDYGAVRLKKHPQYNLPLARMASIVDCRKVAAHARPGAGS